MKRIYKLFIIPLLLLITLVFSGCTLLDDYNTLNGTKTPVTNVRPTNLSIVMDEDLFYVGNKKQLVLQIEPATASNKVTWYSSNSNICSVDQNGLATAINEGSCRISCVSKTDPSVSASTSITVYANTVETTSISIVSDGEYYAGDSHTFEITSVPENGRKTVIFESDNQEVVEFKANVAYFKKAGTATITATYLDSSMNKTNITTSCMIVVKEKTLEPQKITLKCFKEIYVGDTVTIDTRVLPENSRNTFSWSSSNTEVCTVANNQVTGLKSGTSTIRCELIGNSNIYAEFTITVLDVPNMENLESMSLQEKIKAVYHYTNRSVFGVINYQYSQTTNEDEKNSLGTGFVYSVEEVRNEATNELIEYKYLLITNRHVVEGSNSLKVYIAEYDKYIDCTLLAYDDKVDVAVCTFFYSDYIRPLTLASENVETGDFVLAMGNPHSLSLNDSITLGIVSSNRRYYSIDTDNDNVNDWDQLYIQHDAAINPGNSGGPLFNLKGEVVGINTMKISSVDVDTLGFSIPVESFEPLLQYLEKGEKITRPLLGVTIVECKNHSNGKLYISDTLTVTLPKGLDYGMYVVTVTEDSVASRAGVIPGDIIISIDGLDLTDSYAIRQTLGKFIVGSGQSTIIEVYRNNQVLKLEVVF